MSYEPLVYRFASSLEATPDLINPQFSNCTVPIVVWSLWVRYRVPTLPTDQCLWPAFAIAAGGGRAGSWH